MGILYRCNGKSRPWLRPESRERRMPMRVVSSLFSNLVQYARRMNPNLPAVLTALFLASTLAHDAQAVPTPPNNSCQLKSAKGEIHHVIYIQFDNTHFRRDNPN